MARSKLKCLLQRRIDLQVRFRNHRRSPAIPQTTPGPEHAGSRAFRRIPTRLPLFSPSPVCSVGDIDCFHLPLQRRNEAARYLKFRFVVSDSLNRGCLPGTQPNPKLSERWRMSACHTANSATILPPETVPVRVVQCGFPSWQTNWSPATAQVTLSRRRKCVCGIDPATRPRRQETPRMRLLV